MLTYRISESDHCRLVESFLQNLLPAAPLSYLRKIVKSGSVAVNGHPLASGEGIVRLDDELSLKESGRLTAFLSGKRPLLDVLFEDQWIISFNKPMGLAVHRAAEVDDRNLVEVAETFLRRRDGTPPGSNVKLRPVNRLDRGTSGAIVLAKSPTAAGMFGRMVKEEGFGKIYLAIVGGAPPAEGVISAPLEGKESETRYRVLHQARDAAFVAVIPLTGRMHQIRQHFQLIDTPILGDKRYGGRPLTGMEGHLLHSFRTSFVHPATGDPHRIYAPLPAPFLERLAAMTRDRFHPLLHSLPELTSEDDEVAVATAREEEP